MKNRTKLNTNDNKRFIKVITEELSGYSEIIFAYFYGSARDSLMIGDIDIAVFLQESMPLEQQIDLTLTISMELSSKLGLPVDIRPLNNTASGFRYNVTKGEVLFSKDENFRIQYVVQTWHEYLDFKPLLEQNLKDLLET